MSLPVLIAIDWGSSNFRAYLLSAERKILAKKFAKAGLLKVRYREFHKIIYQQIQDWLQEYPDVPVIMSGMIGSRQGWLEVAYAECPADAKKIAQGLKAVDYQDRSLWIVPGVIVKNEDGTVDVMRGEEVQILGALALQGKGEKIFCLPGTHCKWAVVEGTTIKAFSTYMTGELFKLLERHSILGKLMQGQSVNLSAFIRGLELAQKAAALTAQLFQVRTNVLANQLTSREIHSYLSGLLIGHEVKYSLSQYAEAIDKIVIVANSRVGELYAKALNYYQKQPIITDVDQVTTHGLYEIAKLAGLIKYS